MEVSDQAKTVVTVVIIAEYVKIFSGVTVTLY